MFPSLVLAAMTTMPPCWDIFDAALAHSARARHPAYVSYDEHISVTQDEENLLRTTLHVDYRDDGLARVRDERFDFQPMLTWHTEPGPPELGPYGSRRDTWMPQGELFPTIATVRSQGDLTCAAAGIDRYKDHDTYHLTFRDRRSDRPSVKAMWVDTSTHDIWKLVVSGYVNFPDDSEAPPVLTDFEVELAYAGPYLLVNHVVWSYSRHQFSQFTNYFAEYTLGGYSFPRSLPAAYFAAATAVLEP